MWVNALTWITLDQQAFKFSARNFFLSEIKKLKLTMTRWIVVVFSKLSSVVFFVWLVFSPRLKVQPEWASCAHTPKDHNSVCYHNHCGGFDSPLNERKALIRFVIVALRLSAALFGPCFILIRLILLWVHMQHPQKIVMWQGKTDARTLQLTSKLCCFYFSLRSHQWQSVCHWMWQL